MKVRQAIRATSGFVFIFNVLSAPLFLSGCFVKSACYNDADCSEGKLCYIEAGAKNGACIHRCESDDDCEDNYLCDEVTGRCNPRPECMEDDDCGNGFVCNDDGWCEAMVELQFRCKEGMVPVERSFCIDIYEASRPDATETSEGQDSSYATSRRNVIPWLVANNAEADAACRAAGKILCTEEQWEKACMGPDETEYAYDDDYDPNICNGIDTFCRCDGDACGDITECPFTGCYSECGANFHRTPTGSFEECTNEYGVYDINGNLWEHVLNGDQTRIRGGAYNCKDSKKLHSCKYIPTTWTPSAPGFRCCHSGWVEQQDAGVDDGESR